MVDAGGSSGLADVLSWTLSLCFDLYRLHYYRIYRPFEFFMQQYKPHFQIVALHFNLSGVRIHTHVGCVQG
jgi:hypothetical protein